MYLCFLVLQSDLWSLGITAIEMAEGAPRELLPLGEDLLPVASPGPAGPLPGLRLAYFCYAEPGMGLMGHI